MSTPSLGIRNFTRDQLIRMAQLFAGDPDLTRLIDTSITQRTRRELVSTPHLQVCLSTWPAGETTGWHDHGDTGGAFVVLEGIFREQWWEGGATHEREYLPQQERAFEAGHVHRLVNAAEGFGLTIHAYSPALTRVRPYEWVRGRPVRSAA